MKFLSSIFSFKTLSLKLTVKPFVVAVLTLVAIDQSVEFCFSKPIALQSPMADTVAAFKKKITEKRPSQWFLGNSTLYHAVDLKHFPSSQTVKLFHPAATLRASVHMAEYYVKSTRVKPRSVVLFLSKDDLNRNGTRMEKSKRYLENAWEGTLLEQFSSIHRLRHVAPFLTRRKLQAWRHGQPVIQRFDGEPYKAHLEALAKDFEGDFDALGLAAAFRDQYRLSSMKIVYLPVTQVYKKVHDEVNPDFPCHRVTAELKEVATTHGIPFLDYEDFVADASNFIDSYHLNEDGSKDFSRNLASKLEK